MRDVLKAARKAFFLENKPEEALQLLAGYMQNREGLSMADERAMGEICGMASQRLKDYDLASDFFISIGDRYQAGYSQMLKGDLDRSVYYWQPILAERQNHWCLTLYGLISMQFHSMPTFLQIRNHCEADIMNLAVAGQYTFMQNFLRYTEVLADINFEAWKFAGRALFHSGFVDEAGPYLIKGQKILPNDPEIYFHLGQYYYAKQLYEEAVLVLQQCLLITPSYVPALDILRKIRQPHQEGAKQ